MPQCSNHPANEARFECVPCRRYLCYVCAKRIQTRNTTADQCPRCGALATPLGGMAGEGKIAAMQKAISMHRPLVSRLGDVPAYLARPSVLLVLGGLALVEAPLRWAASHTFGLLSIIAFFLVLGLEAGVYFHIVERTAFGEEDLEAPELTHFLDFILLPVIRYAIAVAPLVAGIIWLTIRLAMSLQGGMADFARRPTMVLDHSGPLALILVGLALWPLLTIIAAMTKSVFQMLNPVVWIATLRQLGLDYVVGCIGFYTVLGIEVFLWTPLLFAFQMKVQIWGVTSVLVLFLGYIPMALRARVLGAIAEPHVT
jgi:hypothetical protein